MDRGLSSLLARQPIDNLRQYQRQLSREIPRLHSRLARQGPQHLDAENPLQLLWADRQTRAGFYPGSNHVAKAVLATDADDVVDAVKRGAAVQWARSVPNFESVLIAFKRIKNILEQAREKNLAIGPFQRTE